MSDATKIHLAELPPVACASCAGQYPERLHVDFGSSFDGPVLNSEQVIALGVMNVQIDELIICDECLRAAAALLGLAANERMKDMLADMSDQLTATGEKLRGAIAYIDTLEKQAGARENLAAMLKPPAKTAAKK